MKIAFDEVKKLPLTYKYMEVYRDRHIQDKFVKNINYVKCGKIQSNFLNQLPPFKQLVRIL